MASNNRSLDVWMNGSLVGFWSRSSRGEHSFRYNKDWIFSTESRPISLSIPLTPATSEIRGNAVEAFFGNLLPDNADIRLRIQRRFSCPSTSAFDLLSEIGRDCVGALQILPENSSMPYIREIKTEILDESGVADAIRSATSGVVFGSSLDEDFRISIAGAQEKAAFTKQGNTWCKPLGSTPTTHIFKLPLGKIGAMNADMSQSIENEWLCLKLLEAFGMKVAQTEIANFNEFKVLIVERFDRRLSSEGTWLMRLPQEDLCQASGTPASKKYENEGGPGIETIMNLLLGSRDSETQRRTFLKAQILFWLLAAPDGHAKNFSVFIERQGRYSLTPLYDVMSAYPILGHGNGKIPTEKLKMAMAATGKNRHYTWSKIQGRHWKETASRCGSASLMDDIITEIINTIPQALETVYKSLPPEFPEELAQAIFSGIRNTAERL